VPLTIQAKSPLADQLKVIRLPGFKISIDAISNESITSAALLGVEVGEAAAVVAVAAVGDAGVLVCAGIWVGVELWKGVAVAAAAAGVLVAAGSDVAVSNGVADGVRLAAGEVTVGAIGVDEAAEESACDVGSATSTGDWQAARANASKEKIKQRLKE
jgi:hypothetical protein